MTGAGYSRVPAWATWGSFPCICWNQASYFGNSGFGTGVYVHRDSSWLWVGPRLWGSRELTFRSALFQSASGRENPIIRGAP